MNPLIQNVRDERMKRLHELAGHRPIRIYMSAPYTADPVRMSSEMVELWHILTDYGFYAYCPHVLFLLDFQRQRDHKEWLDWDIELMRTFLSEPGQDYSRGFVLHCDFAGMESKGADQECREALEMGYPVLHLGKLELRDVYLHQEMFRDALWETGLYLFTDTIAVRPHPNHQTFKQTYFHYEMNLDVPARFNGERAEKLISKLDQEGYSFPDVDDPEWPLGEELAMAASWTGKAFRRFYVTSGRNEGWNYEVRRQQTDVWPRSVMGIKPSDYPTHILHERQIVGVVSEMKGGNREHCEE